MARILVTASENRSKFEKPKPSVQVNPRKQTNGSECSYLEGEEWLIAKVMKMRQTHALEDDGVEGLCGDRGKCESL